MSRLSGLLARIGALVGDPDDAQQVTEPAAQVVRPELSADAARAVELQERIARTMALHVRQVIPQPSPDVPLPREVVEWCAHCWRTWPCDTARLLGDDPGPSS